MWDKDSFPEVACSLVSIILIDNNIELSDEKFEMIFQATNLNVEHYWYSWFFTNSIKKTSEIPCKIKENLSCSPEKNEESSNKEAKEESDEDMGFGLFD